VRFRNPIVLRTDPAEERERERECFLLVWGEVEPPEAELRDAFWLGVTEWFRRHQDSEHKKTQFILVQFIAPVAAAVATILAVSSRVSKWAVIPAAIATVASSLLASFGLRENWDRLRQLARELGFEIVEFANGYGRYRAHANDPGARIDEFMKQVDKLSIRSIFVPTKDGEK
jgi:Protein of unknown function (DUF4231)